MKQVGQTRCVQFRGFVCVGFMLVACGDNIAVPAPTSACAMQAPIGGMVEADVVVYGATPAGVAAAVEAAHLGKSVVLLEPTARFGGKLGNGIGIGEIKEMDVIGGRSREFYDAVANHYGATWGAGGSKFEPHVAALAIDQMLCAQPGVRAMAGAELESVTKDGATIVSVALTNKTIVVGQRFIDATYEGDLLAAAGVSYTVGRESRDQYGEPLNGVRPAGRTHNVEIDPYIVPGDPTSGLLPHVSPEPPGRIGSGDRRIQTYTYRVCITPIADNRVPFAPPPGYDPAEMEGVARYVAKKLEIGQEMVLSRMITLQGLPNHKFDVNNVRDLSVDEVGYSFDYPEATKQRRQEIAAEHERYIRAFLYYLSTSERIPENIRTAAAEYGYCKDEYVETDNFPPQIYVREARRMIGSFVMTQKTIEGRNVSDSIGLGNYWLDNHAVSLFVNRGYVASEGHTFTEVAPYQISYASLVPQPAEATNLLVPVCLSASHVAFSSLRVESTYMIMGHAAGAGAALSIDQGVAVQDLDYGVLSQHLLADGQHLDWVEVAEP